MNEGYKKIYYFDLDNTLCDTRPNRNYSESRPFHNRIKVVNKLYEDGNKIVIWTSRGMKTLNGNVKMCYDKYYDLTRDQLVDWGIKFDVLLLGKPVYDHFIDDKCMEALEFFWDVDK